MTISKYDHEPWISTYTGRKVYPWNPKPEDIDPLDIAISLSRTPRFRAHTRDFYSVAQHCVIASHLVPKQDALWALLHDAPEAYIGDLPKPLKQMVPEWEKADILLTRAVCDRFELHYSMPESVKEVDRFLLVTEAALLLTHHVDAWHLQLGVEPDMDLLIDPLPSNTAFIQFMERFANLQRERRDL